MTMCHDLEITKFVSSIFSSANFQLTMYKQALEHISNLPNSIYSTHNNINMYNMNHSKCHHYQPTVFV